MRGDKPDPNIREPFIWDAKDVDLFRPRWMEPKFSTDATVVPASKQRKDKNSIYNHYKTLIALRNSSNALTYGSLESVNMGNDAVCAFVRQTDSESLLVLHNLSGKPQEVTSADLKQYRKIYYSPAKTAVNDGKIVLPPYSSAILIR